METVIIAIGSNLGDRLTTIRKAGEYLARLSHGHVKKASVWETEPVGGAMYPFYNTAAAITTTSDPADLLVSLKEFELQCGREKKPKRWGPRILDLDIISYGNLVLDEDSLIIPHPEYHNRLFVLMPMAEITHNWVDPKTGKSLSEMMKGAFVSGIYKTDLDW